MTMLNKRTMLQGAVLLAAALVMSRMPLFNYLGYEFSVVIALLLPLVIGIPVIRLLRQRAAGGRELGAKDFLALLGTVAREGALLLLLPVIVATMNIVFVKNCSYLEGLWFYLLIPVVTFVWVVALASFCFAATRRALLLYIVLLAATLLYPLYVGYATPQIYSYHVIYGYFPGFSYDEVLRITVPLVLSRGLTLLAALALVSGSLLILLRRAKSADRARMRRVALLLVGCGIVLVVAWIFRVQLSLESSVRVIRETLGSEYRTEHFDIYYSRDSFSDEDIHRVAAEHEFRFAQVATALAVDFGDRIDSYIYPDEEMKRRFIGTGNTNIAKPWRREIHLNKDSWDGVLKHELVHVLAGEFGMPVIRAHYNIGLVEGLAMAIDHDFGNRTLDQYAAAMLTFKLVNDPVRLVSPVGFATHASTLSYVMMGSFCKFLIDRYGIVHFKELYGGSSVEDVYGLPYERLAASWQRTLGRVEVPEAWRRHVEYYFNRPSIFAKECVRAIADKNDRGMNKLRRKEYTSAMELFGEALGTSWNTGSFVGLVRAAFGASRYDSVIALVGEQMRDSTRRSGIANLFLLYGDALWHQGHAGAARKIYEEVLSLDLSPRYSEAAAVRRLALDDTPRQAVLLRYFTGGIGDSAAQRMLHSARGSSPTPLLDFLGANVAFRLHEYGAVLRMLGSDRFAPADSVLRAGREELLGEACFMNREYQQARIHFWQSLNFESGRAAYDRVNDLLERCAWYEEEGGRYLTNQTNDSTRP